MIARFVTAALLAVLLIHPSATVAQSAVEVRIIPRAGAVTPAGWFYEEFSHLGVDPLEWTEAAILRSPLVGVTAEVAVATGLWIRGEVLTTLDGETRLGHKTLNSTSGNTQPTVSEEYHWVGSRLTTATLDLAFPTRFRPLGIQPYVTAGIGAKHYSWDENAIDNPRRTLQRPESGTSLMANVGGGVRFDVVGITFDLVARDAISEYWGEMQHDVTWLAGVSWRLF